MTLVGPSHDRFNAVLIQPDGKLLAAGGSNRRVTTSYSEQDFVIVRYLSDGSLDAGFGTQGVSRVSMIQNDHYINALALQPDGKILAAGVSDNATQRKSFAVLRFLANGQIDRSFGSQGMVKREQLSGGANAVLIHQSEIFVAGRIGNDFAIAKYDLIGFDIGSCHLYCTQYWVPCHSR